MEKNNFFIDGDIDLNEKPLINNKGSNNKIEIQETIVEYKSMMQKSIAEEDMFKDLLKEAKPIDFEFEAHGESIKALRRAINEATDLRSKDRLVSKLEKLKPNMKQKLVIISRNLLELVEKMEFGMAILNEDFYYFNREIWLKKDKNILIAFLGEFAEKAGLEKLEALQFKTKEDLLKQFEVDAIIPISKEKESEIRIPVLNGTLIIKDGNVKLSNFDKSHFLRYMLPLEYNPEAKCPLFDKYFNKVLPDESLQKICFEFIGSAYSDLNHEKTLFLLGSGANGKSIFYNITSACFGKDKITTIPLDSLCGFNSQSTALLDNTLINFCPDINDRKFDIGLFKNLVSRDKIPVKEVYKKVYHMENYGRMAFNCNTLPKEPENSDAFHRRLLIIRFGVTIPEKERDFNLANKIIKVELAGFFNKVIEGLQRLLAQQGFTHSEALNEELRKYRIESNSILSFVDDEGYIPSSNSKLTLEVFYGMYKDYCITNGFHSFGIKNFKSQLKAAGFE